MAPRRRGTWRTGPVPTIAAGSWAAARGRVGSLIMPPAVPIGAFTQTVRVQIGNNGITQTTIAAGGAGRCVLGPAGIGTRWYPQQVSIATQLGPADTSTCVFYLGAVASSNIIATSYSGGGDTIGLAIPMMQPGDLLYAVWAGATAGNWATMAIVGQMDALAAG